MTGNKSDKKQKNEGKPPSFPIVFFLPFFSLYPFYVLLDEPRSRVVNFQTQEHGSMAYGQFWVFELFCEKLQKKTPRNPIWAFLGEFWVLSAELFIASGENYHEKFSMKKGIFLSFISQNQKTPIIFYCQLFSMSFCLDCMGAAGYNSSLSPGMGGLEIGILKTEWCLCVGFPYLAMHGACHHTSSVWITIWGILGEGINLPGVGGSSAEGGKFGLAQKRLLGDHHPYRNGNFKKKSEPLPK